MDVKQAKRYLASASQTAAKRVPSNMVKQMEDTAQSMRDAGASVDIRYGLPTVHVYLEDNVEYFFQEGEASDLLDQVPDNVSAEDYILWSAAGW